jgi:hypothetical protein
MTHKQRKDYFYKLNKKPTSEIPQRNKSRLSDRCFYEKETGGYDCSNVCTRYSQSERAIWRARSTKKLDLNAIWSLFMDTKFCICVCRRHLPRCHHTYTPIHPPGQPLLMTHQFPISAMVLDPTSSSGDAQGPPKKQKKNKSEFCCDEKKRYHTDKNHGRPMHSNLCNSRTQQDNWVDLLIPFLSIINMYCWMLFSP